MAATGLLITTGALGGCGDASSARLEDQMAVAYRVEGRAECRHLGSRGWRCRIEGDPGSGWSRAFHVKLSKRGCWWATPVRWGNRQSKPLSSRRIGCM